MSRLVLSGALLACLLLAACGGTAKAPARASVSPIASASAFPTAVAPPPVASTPVAPPAKFTDDNWGLAVFQATQSDLSQFKGIPVEISGQVFNVEQDATNVGAQMWVYPTQGEGNTVVVFPKAGNPSVSKGQTIQVIGTVDGVLVRPNSQGTSLRLPRVAATKVTIEGGGGAPATPAAAVSGGATASTAASASKAAAYYEVVGTPGPGLNIRTGPGVNYARKGILHNGSFIQVLAQPVRGWYRIQGANFSGYASAAYLRAASVASPKLAPLLPA
ncbi:MAG TPA: SH3 domain-containing protein [Chloroflexota bacterium]|nr:SH3 domain-containing protein [Chloroflexota bacterium]